MCRTCWGTHCELGEHIGNPLGTQREHCENTLGNMEKWKKNPSRPPNLKGMKARHLGPSHWLKGK